MRSGVYKIENIVNNKIYIGSSSDLLRRHKEHAYSLLKDKHVNKHLQNSYNKYGREVFEFTILEEIKNPTKDILLEREQFWIDSLKPEYNILLVAGSTLGYNHSEEVKKQISKSTKGVKKSKEHAENIRNSQKGKSLTKEHKKKLSEAAKNRTKKCHTTNIEIDGVRYSSLKEASILLEIKYNTIQKRLKNPKFTNYKYI